MNILRPTTATASLSLDTVMSYRQTEQGAYGV